MSYTSGRVLEVTREYESPNVYKRHTKLRDILLDGWSRGFRPEQTIREASAAGYAMCVVIPALSSCWGRLDDEVKAYIYAQRNNAVDIFGGF